MVVICINLFVSAVNNEIIPACFLSALAPHFQRWCLCMGAHALSVGWEWCVLAVAPGAAGDGYGC